MSSAAKRFRPVVAIEVDGLLATEVLPLPLPDRAFELDVTLKRNVYPTVGRPQPEWDEYGERRERLWISKVGLDWVKNLLESGTEVVWASTWREYANVYFTRALGLPELPVAVRWDGGHHANTADWKASQLARRFDGRPILWVNNELPADGVRVLEALRHPRDRVLTHLFFIPSSSPVSAGDIGRMDEWLYLAGSAEGHADLRRLRRTHQEWARQRNARG